MGETKQRPGMGMRAGGREKWIDERQENGRREAWRGDMMNEFYLPSKPYKHILDDHQCNSPRRPFIGRIGSNFT